MKLRNTQQNLQPEYGSVATFRKLFGFGNTKTHEMIAAGTLKSIKIGGKRLINLRAARETFAAMETAR